MDRHKSEHIMAILVTRQERYYLTRIIEQIRVSILNVQWNQFSRDRLGSELFQVQTRWTMFI